MKKATRAEEPRGSPIGVLAILVIAAVGVVAGVALWALLTFDAGFGQD